MLIPHSPFPPLTLQFLPLHLVLLDDICVHDVPDVRQKTVPAGQNRQRQDGFGMVLEGEVRVVQRGDGRSVLG